MNEPTPEAFVGVAPPAATSGRASVFADNLRAGVRAVFFRRVDASSFRGGGGQLIALVALGLQLNFAAAFAFVGPEGYFNYEALPSAVFGVLLVLFAGWIIARARGERRLAWAVPIAMASAAISLNIIADALWIAIDRGWLPGASPLLSLRLYYLLFAWWSFATLLAVSRIAAGRPTMLPAAVLALVVLLPTYYVPAGWLWEAYAQDEGDTAVQAGIGEDTLYAQPELLRRTLDHLAPQRPGIADLYFVGFAPYASQDVFMKEMGSVETLLRERFDTSGRSVVLVSHASLAQVSPIATLTSLRRALAAVGERIDPQEDVVLLHVTTHGSETHELSVEFRPLQLDQIRPTDLRAAFDAAGIKWRVVVVSACYSGGFIEALKGPTTLVVTASDARHTSFGCGDDSDYTYFSRAYYDEALRRTRSFPEAFELARESIRQRELREKLEPSNPQMALGEEIAPKLATLARRLSGGEGRGRE